MISVAVVGGTGYTGVELIRLLVMHPEVELKLVTSRAEAGTRVAELFPNLRGYTDIAYSQPDLEALHDCDLVFFATPNGTAMGKTPELINNGTRVIDLAADFRLKNPILFRQWYGMAHECEDLLSKAVYGLPELNREAIRDALIVANPGCYPTAVTLGFVPLLEQDIVDDQHLIADAKSGVSGAGRGAKTAYLHGEVAENFRAYAVEGHRHLPEIRQTLGEAAGHSIGLTFVPHLVPMVRGIEATLYAKMKKTDIDLHELFSRRYADEPFVDVLPPGVYPETRSVRGANMCLLSVVRPQQDDTVVVSAVIDNLVKGAAGQAVQNMNIMFGFDETSGLRQPGLLP